MQALLDYASYMPHGYCLLWAPWLVVLYAGSDLLIALSYFAIPVALALFLRRRPDLNYRGLVWLFAAFILLCGITHIFSILTLWVPVYPLHGAAKLVTGLVSAATAVTLFFLIPRLARIPSRTEMETANTQLLKEVAAHEDTLERLMEMQQTLESEVASRTAELEEANGHLAFISQEAVHRSKNLLTMVSSLARQTARGETDTAAFLEKFTGRLDAMASANAAVLGTGNRNRARLEALASAQLEPLVQTYADRLVIDGPEVMIDAEAAQPLCLALHELATNAMKYGALATDDGTVTVSWQVENGGAKDQVTLAWTENAVLPGASDGVESFGSRLLTMAVPAMLDGTATRDLNGAGLRYKLRFAA